MKKLLLAIFSVSLFAVGCTDLEEEVLSTTLGDNLLTGDEAADGVMAPVYARMYNLFNNQENYFMTQEFTTDECILPFRGGTDWYNGGRPVQMYQHTWTATHNIGGVFTDLNTGSARTLLVEQTLGADHQYSYEAKAMNAWYSMCLFDLFGVAFEKTVEDLNTGTLSRVLRGQDAFDYIMRLYEEAEPGLKTKTELGEAGATRFSLHASYAARARFMLNKAVYLDRYADNFNFTDADMDEVIRYCDLVINSNLYSLETEDYFKIFDVDNHNHPEHIFAMDNTLEANGQNRFAWFTLSRNTIGSIQYRSTGTDGGSATSDFYNTWIGFENDQRFYKEIIPNDGSVTSVADADWGINRGFLQGQQYGIVLNEAGTGIKRDADGKLVIEMLYNKARTQEPINYTVAVGLTENNGHSNGVRVSKYEFDPESQRQSQGRVDIPLLRLADVYLMRAEAKLRKGDAPGALTDVNLIRAARDADPLPAPLTLDALYRERGFELYWEQIRRTDMIRFGKFEGTWTEKTNSDKTRRIFSIPQTVIDAASQYPGYLEQNPGY